MKSIIRLLTALLLPPEAAGDYVKFIKLQLTELLTQYGAVDLMWFDQYNNKYTGAQWGEIKAHVHSLQPDCLVLANNSTDFKKTNIYSYEYPWLKNKKLNALPAENNTNAAEVCDCITPGAWFWQTNLTEKSVTSAAEVVDMLKLCNSRQCNYLLNVPPDRTGRIPEWLVRRLPVTPQQRLQRAMKELDAAKTPENRFYALNDAAKEGFVAGKTDDAQKYAQELMSLLPQFQGNWNYGNAVQDANLVLGRIAVREGRIEDAKKYLLEEGKSPGSPQLDSFGPNLTLAKDLLEKRERQVFLEHFELCRKFWKMHEGRLDQWSQEVKDGKIPDFGGKLVL